MTSPKHMYWQWVAISNNPRGYLSIPNSQVDQLRIRELKIHLGRSETLNPGILPCLPKAYLLLPATQVS